MENTILDLFMDKVIAELRSELAHRREKDENADSAMLKFDVFEVLRSLGATSVNGSVDVQKDYAWLRVEAKQENGFYHRVPDFSQRRQAKKAELAEMKKLAGEPLVEATCIAGLHIDDENTEHWSMKWETLFTSDGEGIAYSGPVRKYHADTDAYDAPVMSE